MRHARDGVTGGAYLRETNSVNRRQATHCLRTVCAVAPLPVGWRKGKKSMGGEGPIPVLRADPAVRVWHPHNVVHTKEIVRQPQTLAIA